MSFRSCKYRSDYPLRKPSRYRVVTGDDGGASAADEPADEIPVSEGHPSRL